MNDIFEFNDNVQMDDLKSGIKYYLKFLERIDEIKKINLYTSINNFEAQIIQIDFSDSVKLNSIQERIVHWDYKQQQKFANIYNICDTNGNHNYNDDDQKACFLQFLRQIKYAAMLCNEENKYKYTHLYTILTNDKRGNWARYLLPTLNGWSGLNKPLNETSGNNSAFNNIVDIHKSYIFDDKDKEHNMATTITNMQQISSLASPHYWWLVANPRIWNFADLPTGETQTYTALNENGNKRRVYQNFADAAVGDKLVGYVSQPQKKLVALCTITAKDGDNIIFRKDEQLADPISYAELKDMPELASMQFFQNSNGSLFSLSEKEASALMDCIRERNPRPPADAAPPYTAEDFCREVYMAPERHARLCKLLLRQKNIILQGPPGVGKTYAARRLAWSVMGCKDDSRVTMVQFHQNYAYEDFVMGYRPDGAGFVLREGVFYQACKRAANDAGRGHFFIIDEINRGNLSRIFGELLMLLENGHRGESLPLPYNGERFSVPPNLHVIGMMNTADRSLALMDYALRRRFGFCAIPPGFGSAGFSAYLESLGDKPKLRALVEVVKKLNEAISEDASLGRGYCVGHSYFCGMQPEDVTDERLADIVECDLLPLLEEYWFDDADKRRQWEKELKGTLS
ncbi:MAG: EVE domain-containing protein [Desulfovibrio desulfuricans]|nr:EVE domain-containing protein [Desulfovibrio desulfuricans]